MIDAFLLIGLPYLAIATAVIGGYWRWKNHRYTLSSLSSQFLEDRALKWGSAPWHIGIGIVLLGHLLAAIFPRAWSSLLTVPGMLLFIESVGVAGAVLALLGLGVLITRRLTSARIQAVTSSMDLMVVGLLFAQVFLGLMSALHFRYGAAWSTGTVVPYFWSLLTLRPDMAYVADFPALFKLHLAGAWLILLLLPFTRLMHMLALPLPYLWRAPQIVLWNTARRQRQAFAAAQRINSRREFVKGFAGLAGAAGLLGLGVSEKLLNFFKGPRPDAEAEAALLQKKLTRLQLTAEARQLELERQRKDLIVVARYAELTEKKGKYFIDYLMAPGLAFKDSRGIPIVISAKCTHLGCTVGSDADERGRILCPCHISYFDIRTGQPEPGAPARLPLPFLGWALVDATGRVVASQQPGGAPQGAIDPAVLAQCNLCITKPAQGMV